ncbi:hypothetical protein Cni_G04640 [Canna indica]|uniref:Uncharacterized protein n=1 Tax=Canna indica TaxID=4628 RepID=A0AAQ3Q2V8_9LILI|nr:hypothetical protein Cni_G04640 [Canna indica]
MRWFPTVFRESSRSNDSGDDVPWFSLSEDALSLRHEELQPYVVYMGSTLQDGDHEVLQAAHLVISR